MSGGVEGLLFPEFVESPALLTCLKPIFGAPGAEHALAAMLMFTRRFHRNVAPSPMTQHDNGYDEQFQPVDLDGRTVGILGLGSMGRTLAEKASCLGMRVLALTRTSRSVPDCVEQSFQPGDLSGLVACCDFVVVAVPVTAQTRGMIDDSVLRCMKSDGVLIDCSGRPSLFDYHALERAIMEGWIAGVCLQPGGASPDQYIPARDAAFWQRENVVVSPCRGTSAETERKALDLFFDNLDRFESGQPLLGLVDKQAGY
jgi:phosphoglycerate dehydrogenase-like enzyme